MADAYKHCVVVAVIVYAIVMLSLEANAQRYCSMTAYRSQVYTAYRSRSSVYTFHCGRVIKWWETCGGTRYHQQSYTAYRIQPYSICCPGYGTSSCHALCSRATSCPNGGSCTAPNTCACAAGWTGSRCTVVVNCGTLTNPMNGRVNHTAGTTFGQIANYSCNTGYNMVGDNTRTCQATGVWSGSAPTCEGGGNVTFSLKNTTYQNNSLLNLEDIGEGDDALLCTTDLTACCKPPYSTVAMGNWYFSNETRVPSEGSMWDFYTTRGLSMVVMHRRRGGVNGIYRCEIPDALGVTQTIYIEASTEPTPTSAVVTPTLNSSAQSAATEQAVPLKPTQFNSPLVAGMAGGGGMTLVITATILIVVGGVIIKRRRASERDATPDVQNERMEITPKNEVPTYLCDTQKRGTDVHMKETHLYEVPTSVIKIVERDTQKEKVNIEMKEDVSYEVPTPVNMTEVQAYGSPPNKP